MDYIFSKHAKEQMKRRNIEETEIQETLKNPEQIIKQETYYIYQSIMTKKNKKYLLRVFINVDEKPVKIITCYKTTKIDKYYES